MQEKIPKKTDQLFEEFYKIRNSEDYFFNALKVKKQLLRYISDIKTENEVATFLIVEQFYESFLICLKASCMYILEKYQKHYDSKLSVNDYIKIFHKNFRQIEAIEKTKQLYLFEELLVESLETLKNYFGQILKEISKNKSEKVIKEVNGTVMQERLNLLISEFKFFYNQIKKHSEFIDDPEFKSTTT